MIELKLSVRERELIHLWLESLQERAGHWGDGQVTFPDEVIVMNKIDHEQGLIRITRYHLELILEWAQSSHRGVAFTIEEDMLAEKLRRALSSNGQVKPTP